MSTLAPPPVPSPAGGPRLTAPSGIRRLFAARDASFATHLDTFGPLPLEHAGPDLVADLQHAGLDGRGGAHFATWRKLGAARAEQQGRRGPASRGRHRAVVIANGAEGEPLSRKDATLLAHAPHLVIDGLLLAAATVGASRAVLYTTSRLLPGVEAALRERGDASGVTLVEAPETFLSGEASAAVAAIEGRPAVPSDRVVRLTSSGVDGRPTLVQNVETLAQLALLARFGVDWFRSVGAPAEPGTRLVTVGGGDGRSPLATAGSPGGAGRVLEVTGTMSLRRIVEAAGIDTSRLRAVLVGGFHGVWLPVEALDLPFTREALQPWGASPGAGIVWALSADRCGLAAAAEVTTYLAGQSARQCGPCLNGLPRLADVLGRLARGDRAAWLPGEVTRLAGLVTGRGSCHHPDGTARLVFSTLQVFADDVQRHLEGRCLVGVRSTGVRSTGVTSTGVPSAPVPPTTPTGWEGRR
ncbi:MULTISPECIES: NADH-ubiquinone oxidoreductase-F iron-sulfur binding region domain-containing protein [unclassified Frigoribacterium]|uniref:NADH-ubiquinone oxidoreductase-F iron-sulfur binding region domain-containing protein n=1 Tax=unclassified Frigoribacterium TaxID=2627005 RepID=UPI0009E95DD5|nr:MULTISPECIES: NADH-ubiquinone oxidoreductase-F iron-sulfur binding region domain-containing protein [unclassified Frigoribacterium]